APRLSHENHSCKLGDGTARHRMIVPPHASRETRQPERERRILLHRTIPDAGGTGLRQFVEGQTAPRVPEPATGIGTNGPITGSKRTSRLVSLGELSCQNS